MPIFIKDGSASGGDPYDGQIAFTLADTRVRLKSASWPLNGEMMQGAYMISRQDEQFTNIPGGLPKLDWNTQLDVLIIQGLGWRNDSLLDSAAERFALFKSLNPNGKLLYYFLPAEVAKNIVGGVVGYPEEVNELINSATRGHPDWYMADTSGSRVESQFDPTLYHRANAYVPQFNSPNSFGRTMIEQFFLEHYQQFTEVRANGFTLLELIDGFYWDALDSGLERIYQDGSNGAVPVAPDQNRDNVAESRYGETIPADPTNEDGYGGARMQRRGAVTGKNYWQGLFGPDKVMWRNGTKDGIDYSFGNFTDPPNTNEFYQQFPGSIHERINNDLGLRNNGTDYDVDFLSFEEAIRRHLRMRAMNTPAAQHPWGPYGFYGLMMVVDLNTRATPEDITQLDYACARFYGGIAALCRSMFAPYMNPWDGFPRIDEYIWDIGEPVNDPYPEHLMGTVDMTVPGGPVTLRPPDYTSGNAKFWWRQFTNGLWVVRGDPPPQGASQYGNGTPVNCALPDPGTGKQWATLPFAISTYTNPKTGWQTRNNSPTVNFGEEIGGAGFGELPLLPWHAQCLWPVDA